jgi:S1-C subfamily serine protease
MNKTSLFSGLLGGLAVAVVGAILLATGVIETGDDEPARPTIAQAVPDRPSSDDEGDAGGKSVSQIYDEDGPGVAFIQAQGGGGGLTRGGDATGSGFVLDKEGYILTNAHVVEGSSNVQVSFDDTGDLIDAKLIGADPSTDLAVIKIDPRATKLRPLRLGDSEKTDVGDPVVAIGNPFGYSRTVTTGIVSAKQRRIDAPNGFQIDNVIQTDAAINPGNSGGPLLDASGRVIGINSQIATGGSRGSVGIGFAVPVNTAKTVVPQLKRDGKIERAYLGITSARITKDIAEDLNLPTDQGALVQDVVPNGPADKAGIRGGRTAVQGIAAGGDLITELDGRKVTNPNDIAAAIADNKPGDRVRMKMLRGGKEREVVVTLGKRPAQVPGQERPEDGGEGGGILPLP